jgi:hypothetical protein
MQLVCSADGGVKLLATSDDGGPASPQSTHGVDCALCLPAMVPPPQPVLALNVPQPLGHALKPEVQAHIAALVGAPLPPRGPPAFA